ncbi:hypothetical protein BH925_03750 [Rodentibacter pneumotropicus]|uniref:hypothetical protein n=1 Tax=Rodentibacter pneumotropicus TaxID=758 RepID=UPI0009894A71|nr:hypothetical protein [Rodentibacter pneumotropicus]OOF60762.1 hypothetical protein BH925_03750 [Rodentibacter pneumotropicus]
MSFQDDVIALRSKNFEPFINAISFIKLISFVFKVSQAEAISVIDEKAKESEKGYLTAISVTSREDFGFLDKQKTIKVLNSFDVSYGFCFLLIESVAFMSKVNPDDIFVSVNDLKNSCPILKEIIPVSMIVYIDKNKLPKLKNKPNRELAEKDLILNRQSNEILKLNARITELENQLQTQSKSVTESTPVLEYSSDLPESTNAEKLADFISLIIDPELLDDGQMPTYSKLHTKLNIRNKTGRIIPSKNTIKKYLNQP